MYSLRRELAVRFSITAFVALTLIAIWAVIGVRRTLVQQIDRALSATLTLQVARLSAGDSVTRQAVGTDFQPLFEGGARLVIVRNAAGDITQASARDLADFPMDTASLIAALDGRTSWTDGSWRFKGERSVYAPAPSGGVLQVAASLRPLADANRNVILFMLGTVLLSTIVIAAGAYRLAGSTLQPVLDVASQARAIAPDTGARISAHTDVEEYESLILVLNELLERSDRVLAAQRRLTADVGHELRTPLTALRGEFEIALRAQRTPEDYQKTLRSGLEEIDHLHRISDALVLISRARAGTLQLRREPTDINDLVMRVLHNSRRRVEENRLRVRTQLAYAGATPQLDGVLTRRVLEELVSNALSHTPEGGTVTLTTTDHNGMVTFQVDDTGPGIDEGDIDQLFDPFFRADEARTRTTNAGLSLAMVASIVNAHGGTVKASNRTEGGARFEVAFPLNGPQPGRAGPSSA